MPNRWTDRTANVDSSGNPDGTYTYGSGRFVLENTGSVNVVVALSTQQIPPMCEITVECQTRAHEIGIVIRASGDGRDGFRFWVDASGNVKKAEYKLGVLQGSVTTLGSGAVNSDGIPYLLGLRVEGTEAKVTVTPSGDTTSIFSTQLNENHIANERWGIFSSIDGAVAQSVAIYQIAPKNETRAEVLLVVCGGSLYVCTDSSGTQLRQIQGRVADTVGRVGIAEWQGTALIVGGGKAHKYDPITDELTKWYDDQHVWNGGDFSTLPGATPPTATNTTAGQGTCGATIIEVHNNRVFLSGVGDTPEVVYASATNDPDSWRILNFEIGQASAFTVNAQDTVTCLRGMPSQNLMIGCKNFMRVLLGDPLWGQVTMPTIGDSGISGPNSIAKNDTSLAVAHSPSGLFNVSADVSLPVNITNTVLTEGIQFPTRSIDQYQVNLVRDPDNHRLWVFITPYTYGPALHFCYEERVGKYQPGTGGLFPCQFDENIGPTAVVYWRGKVLLGTRNGLVLRFDETATTDRVQFSQGTLTQNIESWMFLTMTAESHPIGDTIITSWRALLANDSDEIDVRIYGGANAESLHNFDINTGLYSCSVSPFSPPFICSVRAPAIGIYIYNDGSEARYWELEQVVANFEVGTMTTFTRVNNAWDPCKSPGSIASATTQAGDPDPTGGGGGGPGDSYNSPGDGYGGKVSGGIT